MKRSLALASAVVLLGTVGACGDDDSSSADSYCDALEQAQEDFGGGLEEFDFDSMDDLFGRVSEMADSAPDEVADEWETVETTFSSAQETLDEAGLSMEDLAAIQEDPTNLPEGVDQAALMEVSQELQDLSGPDVTEAMESIGDHAEEECDVEFSNPSD